MGLRQRLMALTYDRVMAGYEGHAGPRRAELLAGLEGRVVELGPGTGVNLEHLPADVEWHGVEPSEPMRAALLDRWKGLRSDTPSFVEFVWLWTVRYSTKPKLRRGDAAGVGLTQGCEVKCSSFDQLM